jgi:hypothetical protein
MRVAVGAVNRYADYSKKGYTLFIDSPESNGRAITSAA